MQNFFEKYDLNDQVIAAGVSGGADSLALALRLHDEGKKVVALTVDHGLRAESAAEAQKVAEIMRANGIEHHVLVWQGEKPKTGLEEAARQARYQLMFDYCRQHHIGILATGHHRRDQAETFLLRLQRGSGVYGLSGILPISQREGITIIRPQLEMEPEELRAYLTARQICWVEDPMNGQEDFARVKVRKFLPELEKIGLTEKRLAETASTLANTRLFLQSLADEFIENHVRWWGDVVASLSWAKLSNLHREIGAQILGQLIKKASGASYQPEATEIQRVLNEKDKFKGCTLGNCELFLAAKRLWIVPQDKSNHLMSKAEWEEFVLRQPQYRHAGLPYKVRRALKIHLKD